jgi:hypothetical protein
MKEIKRSALRTNDDVVIANMHIHIWKKCMYGGKFSPIEMGMSLNYDPGSLTEAMCQICPNAKTYEEYTIIQWAALFSLYDDEPILKECFKFFKDFI